MQQYFSVLAEGISQYQSKFATSIVQLQLIWRFIQNSHVTASEERPSWCLFCEDAWRIWVHFPREVDGEGRRHKGVVWPLCVCFGTRTLIPTHTIFKNKSFSNCLIEGPRKNCIDLLSIVPVERVTAAVLWSDILKWRECRENYTKRARAATKLKAINCVVPIKTKVLSDLSRRDSCYNYLIFFFFNQCLWCSRGFTSFSTHHVPGQLGSCPGQYNPVPHT